MDHAMLSAEDTITISSDRISSQATQAIKNNDKTKQLLLVYNLKSHVPTFLLLIFDELDFSNSNENWKFNKKIYIEGDVISHYV